jgi:hypothetical protein
MAFCPINWDISFAISGRNNDTVHTGLIPSSLRRDAQSLICQIISAPFHPRQAPSEDMPEKSTTIIESQNMG